ncbi:MAG: hypothetical protein IT324_03190 [Anaerolineae bacterium]|nr:hypothetical protein [Anaerolineae bacterium]
MSLIELILAQKAILLTLVIAVMILMAGVGLSILPRIKASNAKKARQKARAEALARQHALEQAEEEAAAEAEELAAVAAEAQAEVQAAPPEPAPAPVAPTVVKPAPVAAAPPKPAPAPTPAPTPAPAASSGGSASSAMQDILSSVFANDEAMARYEVLLRGLDNIDINDLLALCNQVADQLRTGNMAVVND